MDNKRAEILDLYAQGKKTSDIIALGYNVGLVKEIRTASMANKALLDREDKISQEVAVTMGKNKKRQMEFLRRYGINTEAYNG